MEENKIVKEKKKGNASKILDGTLRILKKEKKLLLLSIAPAFIILIVFLLILVAFLYFFHSKEFSEDYSLYIIIATFIFFTLSYLIACFFRAVLIYCLYQFLKKESINFKKGFFAARKNILNIIKWTITDVAIKTGTGFINREETNYIKSSISSATVLTWDLLTIFVVPVIILENLSPKEAIIKSSQLFIKTWKNAVVFDFSLGIIFLILAIIGVFLAPILAFPIEYLFFLTTSVNIGTMSAAILSYCLFVTIMLAFGIIVVTLREIFFVVLYDYAEHGVMPSDYFDEKIIKESFK